MANVDVEVNFQGKTIEEMLVHFIKCNVRTPSQEVFDREYLASGNIYEAVGKAVFNEEVTIALELGKAMDEASKSEEEKSDESRTSE